MIEERLPIKAFDSAGNTEGFEACLASENLMKTKIRTVRGDWSFWM